MGSYRIYEAKDRSNFAKTTYELLAESIRKKLCLDRLQLSWEFLDGLNFPIIYDCIFDHVGFSNCDLFKVHGIFDKCAFKNCRLNWESHDQLACILQRHAKYLEQRMIAGLLLVERDKCWEEFLRIRHKQRRWALTTLAKYIVEDDNHPRILDKYRTKK